MLKLLKWIYGLGYRAGYNQAVADSKVRFVNPKITQSDEEFMAEIEEVMRDE